jgi:DNA-binding transcriptional ArsR family regulator
MVVDRKQMQNADRVFHALSDSTRRDILRHSFQEEHSVSALARFYDMSFAAIQKHVAVLELAALVSKRKHGREQLVRANVDTLRYASRLLEEFEVLWRDRLNRFGDVLEQEKEGKA